MARIEEGIFRNWANGDRMSPDDYKREREILRVAINDIDANVGILQPVSIEGIKNEINTAKGDELSLDARFTKTETNIGDISQIEQSNIIDALKDKEQKLVTVNEQLATIGNQMKEQENLLDTVKSKFLPNKVSKFQQNFHLNPVDGFMNDIQSAFFRNGEWHFYFLFNKDFKHGGNGTEWYHVTTKDWVSFENHGVAIPKYTTPQGDVASGTIYEDYDNTLGFGMNAVIAYLTSYGNAGQTTNIWYSNDNGFTFKPYKFNPIQNNPTGSADFRDPYVFRIDGIFYMYLAEGGKFGIYKSTNGINFSYLHSIMIGGLGLLECPNLFLMDVDGDPNHKRWVLFFGANGGDEVSTGTYYISGMTTNGVFTPETPAKRLDSGPDYYGAKIFTKEDDNPNDVLLSTAWIGNWGYTTKVPFEGFGGSMSLCRELRLKSHDGYTIETKLLPSFRDYLSNAVTGYAIDINNDRRILPFLNGEKFYLKAIFRKKDNPITSKFGVVIRGENYTTTWTYNPPNQQYDVSRECNDFPNNSIFDKKRFVNLPFNGEWMEVHFVVDSTSVEIVLPDDTIYTMAKYGTVGKEDILLYCDGECIVDYEYYDILKTAQGE
ncbi:MAG: glycoside hydrolase family 32 protein [Bacillus sp. (in: firmicutes)]